MNTPCTKAYKWVSVGKDGRMYSCNLTRDQQRAINSKLDVSFNDGRFCFSSDRPLPAVLRYKMRHYTTPEDGTTAQPVLKAVFCFKNIFDAEGYINYVYHPSNVYPLGTQGKKYLLTGYAFNLRLFSWDDAVVRAFPRDQLSAIVCQGITYLSDGFLPLGIVRKWEGTVS